MSNLDLDIVYEKTLGKVLNYLSYGLKTSKEIADKTDSYLRKIDLNPNEKQNIIQKINNRLQDLDLIDDKKVLNSLVSSITNSSKPKNKNKISNYLRKRGFSSFEINDIFSNLDSDHDFTCAMNDYKKKLKTSTDRLKIKKYLLNRGYTFEIIDRVFSSNIDI